MNNELLELNNIAKTEGATYNKKRYVYNDVSLEIGKKTFIAIIGPRGSGKTVLLRQLASDIDNSFYISLDSVILDKSLFDIAKELVNKGIKCLLLDEIHFLSNYERELKKIYDFLNIQIMFTGSLSISLYSSVYDLSRRVKQYLMLPFSFNEYLYFKDINVEKISYDDFVDPQKSKEYYGKTIAYEGMFDDYIQGGLYPFTINGLDIALFSNILNKIIQKDIIQTTDLTLEDVQKIIKVVKFIGLSPVEDMNYSSISSNTKISRYKVEKYIELLEKAFILNVIKPKGTNVTREPKILMNLPYRLLYKPLELCIGDIREDFFVEASIMNGLDINYLKNPRGEKTPDYYIRKYDVIFEVGGKHKNLTQFKGIKSKHKFVLTHPGQHDYMKRPLFMFGMLQ